MSDFFIGMKYLGIDYGTKRIGLALSDDEGRMAFPLSVFQNDGSALKQIVDLVATEKVEGIVMGESKNLGGAPNLVFEEAARLARLISEKTGIEVVFHPEMYTSYEAGRMGSDEKLLDASAAALILNSFLKRSSV